MWKAKSKQWILETGKCERCPKRTRLTCHHKHYETLGCEKRRDIKVLCWECHKKYHTDLEGNRVYTKEFEKKLKEIRNKPKQVQMTPLIKKTKKKKKKKKLRNKISSKELREINLKKAIAYDIKYGL